MERRVGPDPAAVARDDAFRGRQADAVARVFGRAVQALERREEVPGIGHVETGAVVAHVAYQLAAGRRGAELDARALGLAGELPGVREQVLQHAVEQPG